MADAVKGPPGFHGPFQKAQRPGAFPVDPKIFSINPSSDRDTGGATVTITGKNFRNDVDGNPPTILFDGVAATSVVVVSSTSITCTVPAHDPGLVDVEIFELSPTGYYLAVGAFAYVAGEALEVDPPYGLIAGGTQVTIKGTNFESGSTVYFGGVAATGVGFVDSQTILCTTPAHAKGFVDVEIVGPAAAYTLTFRNGFQYVVTTSQEMRRMPSISVAARLNQAPHTCQYRVDGDSPKPQVGDPVTITDGATTVFAGIVQTVEQDWEGQTDQLAWRVTAVDYTWLLNRRRPFGSFDNVPADQIVNQLMAQFTSGFTTTYVQTELQVITIAFDGTQTMSEALNAIGEAIGGGHWYVDNDRVLHFFHVQPVGITLPTVPNREIALGPGSAMVATEVFASGVTYTFPQGFYMFFGTFVYDDGTESDYWPGSNLVALGGGSPTRSFVTLSSIPIGADVAGHSVVKRRIYLKRIYNLAGAYESGDRSVPPIEERRGLLEIEDNVTTSVTTTPEPTIIQTFLDMALITGFVAYPTDATPPPVLLTPPPLGPSSSVSVQVRGDGVVAVNSRPQVAFWPAFNTSQQPPSLFGQPYLVWNAQSLYQIKVCFLYRDGSISLPGPPSNLFRPAYFTLTFLEYLLGISIIGAIGLAEDFQDDYGDASTFSVVPVGVDRVPIGDTLNSVEVIARLFYVAELPANLQNGQEVAQGVDLFNDERVPADRINMFKVLQDNVTTFDYVGPGVGTGARPPINANEFNPPVFPHPDGPYLEDANPPDPLDIDNDDLIRDPQLESTEDLSQIRNRIFVIGKGTSITADTVSGSKRIPVADATFFSSGGGFVILGRRKVVQFLGIDVSTGAQTLYLKTPLDEDILDGTAVELFVQIDDQESQRVIAALEGGDGIHEYTVADATLVSPFELYVRGQAEIELFGRPTLELRYATRDTKSKVGQTIHVDLTDPPLFGDFLIQEVNIDQFHDESDDLTPRYTVRASSLRFDINDLLLKIVTNSSKRGSQSGVGGTNTGGIAASASSSSSSVTPREELDEIWGGAACNSLGTNWGGFGDGDMTGPTGASAMGGTLIDVIDADGVVRRSTVTSAQASGLAFGNGLSVTTSAARLRNRPGFDVILRLGPVITDYHLWICMIFPTAGTQQGFADGTFRQSGVVAGGFGIRYANGGTVPTGGQFEFFAQLPSAAALAVRTTIQGISAKASMLYRFQLRTRDNANALVRITSKEGQEVEQEVDLYSYLPAGTEGNFGPVIVWVSSSVNTKIIDTYAWKTYRRVTAYDISTRL